MADVHVLNFNPLEGYTVVVHDSSIPAGNNTAGVSWANVLIADGTYTAKDSVLPVGNGIGQITQPEQDDLTAGTLLEFTFVIPEGVATSGLGNIQTYIDGRVASLKSQFVVTHVRYGQTINFA